MGTIVVTADGTANGVEDERIGGRDGKFEAAKVLLQAEAAMGGREGAQKGVNLGAG